MKYGGTFSKKFLVLALFVLVGAGGFGASKVIAAISSTPIQEAVGFGAASNPVYAITFSSAPTNGNFLTFESVVNSGVSSISSITQTGVTWRRAVIGTSTAVETWYGIVGAGAGTTATATLSSTVGAVPAGSMQEWSGVKISGTILGPVNTDSSITTSPAAGPITPVAGKNVLLIMGTRKGGTISSQPSGFSLLTQPVPGGTGPSASYQVVPSASGSYNSNWVFSTNSLWQATVASFYGAIIDSTVPSVPGSATTTPVSPTRVDLSWASSTDNEWVSYYNIFRCTGASCTPTVGIASTTAGTLLYSDTTLATSTAYGYAISATDEQGNQSAKSSTVYATTTAGDVTPPVISSVASTTAGTTATVTWTT
ncbi:MAG: Fibronectin type domain protein, partial [Parcubacteria group bacterium]|nr:Fibronectin type domain protein [Parcubacteria group bacterium]